MSTSKKVQFPETAQEAARRGSQLLDLIRPGWHRKIRLDKLQLSNACHCVLGQVYGSLVGNLSESERNTIQLASGGCSSGFEIGRYRLAMLANGAKPGYDDIRDVAARLGFAVHDTRVYYYDALQEAWVQEIRTRKGLPKKSKSK